MFLSNLKILFLRNIIIWVRYFLKYILIFILMLQFRQFDLNIPLSLGFYSCVITKQMNSNKYYITTFSIPCNIYFYSYVITITVYQTCSKKKNTKR